ncbi:PQQ-dependent catabolism-associated CXXCW motif protein/quinoprotein dehydrogenase-associated probable ABC transporter substrate-binding protein [Breoghania corrubedonensis]|uniref:PQQ-dependent catabolism-associated CXXCW motif protein/quinoprotein dehydrogenase-associated probable ABC transporter substrate-binding protein n=2 Tax=Breoghania corrubedonensis TaxID=665038 RepID=A0A2T5VE02_9HYPH|nr:PQQ-dependent catabolism-associated CXXCW motif protein/quinoprotein dehydrogenase-associated probable ABC transporter substrate-binding protein [Breoghania corrubedonensis]
MAAAGGPARAQENTANPDVVDRTELRVCADPGNLPYSNDKGEGFENRIAEIVAEELGLPVRYTWFPQTIGFVRRTLGEKRCDLIIGVAATNELMQNTNPYYNSTYVMVHRKDAALTGSLGDPALAGLKIGAQPRTPAASLLARHGLLGHMKSYPLIVDTRLEKPARAMVADVENGTIDVALAWGPLAGYWIREVAPDLVMVPIESEAGTRLSFLMSMGIRYNEPDWKHRLNRILRKRKDDIDAILAAYNVPLLDRRGQLIKAQDTAEAGPKAKPVKGAPVPTAKTANTIAEPEGYRMDDYRAPVPAGLAGARTVDVEGLIALRKSGDPVLIDVFPAARKPQGRSPDQIWREPKRATIKGAHWLANMGFGALSDHEESAFRAELERLSDNGKRTLVFFCEPQCWMSWNAAKRALTYGFDKVAWYPGGVARWSEADQLLEEMRPWRPAE